MMTGTSGGIDSEVGQGDDEHFGPEFAASRRIAKLVAADLPETSFYEAINQEFATLVGAEACWLTHFDLDGNITLLGAWGEEEVSLPHRSRTALSDELRWVWDKGRPYRFDSVDIEDQGPFAVEARRLGIRSAVGVPITAVGRVWGICTVASFGSRRLPDDTHSRLASIVELAAASIVYGKVFSDLTTVENQQEAMRRIAELAAVGQEPDIVINSIVVEASALLGGRSTFLARVEEDGESLTFAAASDDAFPKGAKYSVVSDGFVDWIFRSGRPVRMDDIEMPGTVADQLGIRSAVGVPIIVHGRTWGILAAASPDAPLPLGTEHRLSQFAGICAAAVSSGQAHEDHREVAREQAALLRVAALAARGVGGKELFDTVAEEAAGLIENEPTTLVQMDGPRSFVIVATYNGPAPVGMRVHIPEDDEGTIAEGLRTMRPSRRDNYAIAPQVLFTHREFGVGSSVAIPIIVEDRVWGFVGTLTEGRPLPTWTEQRLNKFAELVSAAIANNHSRSVVEMLADDQLAMRRVAELSAGGGSEQSVLLEVVKQASISFQAEFVGIFRFDDRGLMQTVVTEGASDGLATYPGAADGVGGMVKEVWSTGSVAMFDSDPVLREIRPDLSKKQEFGSGLSVPIHLNGQLWGALVAIVQGGPIPAGTADRLTYFAEVAATSIAGAQARGALEQLTDGQAALLRVAEVVARGDPLEDVFTSISVEASNILGGISSALLRYDEDGAGTVVAACKSPAPVGLRIPPNGFGIGQVYRDGVAVRVASFQGTNLEDVAQDLGVEAGVAVPISVEGRTWGALTASTPGPQLPDDVEDRLAELAAFGAVAIANAQNKVRLTESRARVVATADETRQKLQRDVHDGAQQRLVQTVLTLKMGMAAVSNGQPDLSYYIREALEYAEKANSELRDLVHGILPASLSRGGLQAGLESFIVDVDIPVNLSFSAPRLLGEVEVTAYFIVAEALTNVVKHANATRAVVDIGFASDQLTIEIADDGVGGADPGGGTGLTGLRDRIEAARGTLTIVSPLGGGTSLRAVLPIVKQVTD
jgi:signal transduction histidine kinase